MNFNVLYSEKTNLELKAMFYCKNIDVSLPGFYNDINFISEERKNPKFLEMYAKYINNIKFTNEYIKKAEFITCKIAEILSTELKKSKQKGRCIDISLIFSKMLEKERIWNYTIRGALAIEGKCGTCLNNTCAYFFFHDIYQTSGHTWLYIPPFFVVDITLKYQLYSDNQAKLIEFLPEINIKKEVDYCNTNISHIYSPELRLISNISCVPNDLQIFQNIFKPFKVKQDKYTLFYYPCGITASDGSLEENKSIQLNGLSAIDIYENLVKPTISK